MKDKGSGISWNVVNWLILLRGQLMLNWKGVILSEAKVVSMVKV
jgi:hypothetical protein